MPTGKDGERELFAGPVTDEMRDQLKEMVRQDAYKADVQNLALAAKIWLAQHPAAVLEWNELGNTLVTGDLGDLHVRGYLAKSPEAFELLQFMDETTGRRGSLMQARFALQFLQVVP